MNLQGEPNRISAKRKAELLPRICQGDIFRDIVVIENVSVSGNKLNKDEIQFPYVICLNQDCDLQRDFDARDRTKDLTLLHLAIAPAFIFELFLSGKHWGRVFSNGQTGKRDSTFMKKIMDNETPRFHYLNFPDPDLPEMIIDFKHFFTINRDVMYNQLDNRLCSLSDLYKEKISQRFSYFISRIGLPES